MYVISIRFCTHRNRVIIIDFALHPPLLPPTTFRRANINAAINFA